MHATSSAQLDAWNTSKVPPAELVRDDVIVIPQRMPHGYLSYSLSYAVIDAHGRAHVIDPGWDSDENWEVLAKALAQRGLDARQIASITLTHLHPDHGGMAKRMRAASGAPVAAHRREQASVEGAPTPDATQEELDARLADWGVPRERWGELRMPETARGLAEELRRIPDVDRRLEDGDRLDVPGSELEVIWMPGHTPGHLGIVDAARGLVYTGDHVIPTIFAGLGLGGASETNPVADSVRSLERIAEYDAFEVLPGHGYRFRGLAERAEASGEHHLRRSREVAAVLAEGGDPTTWQLASRLTWTAGWDGLQHFFLYSALAQTAMHRAYVESPEFEAQARS